MSDALSEPVVLLPRGGTYFRTSAGPVQIGAPPETIKDTMALGIEVPVAYVLPQALFDRRRGISVAEFEFPAYYNFFLLKRKARLVVDDRAVEMRIRAVFRETLFGPDTAPTDGEFAEGYPKDAQPDFARESDYFRRRPDGTRLEVDDLVEFMVLDRDGVAKLSREVHVERTAKAYIVRDGNREVGRAPLTVQLPPRENAPESVPKVFKPPAFGISVLGGSHGFDPAGKTTGFMLWMGGRGLLVDPPIDSTEYLRNHGVPSKLIDGVILTHCHADHDAGTFQKLLEEEQIALYTTPHILGSFLRKYCALSGLKEDVLRRTFHFHPVRIGAPVHVHGGELWFKYMLHSIPTVGFEAFYGGNSLYVSADTLYDPERIDAMLEASVFKQARRDELLRIGSHHSAILHEAGIPPLHTPTAALAALPKRVRDRLYLVHIASKDVPEGLRPAEVGIEHTIRINGSPPRFDEAMALLEAFSMVEFFRDLPLSRARALLQVAHQISMPAGEKIVAEGTRGDSFYVIVSGVVQVVKKGKVLKKYRAGDYFGETALILDQPRGADVIAKTAVDLIALDRNDFMMLLRGTDILRRLEQLARIRDEGTWELFDKNSVLSSLSSAQKTHLQTYLSAYEARQNEVLWADNEAPGRAFLVDDAVVELQQEGETVTSFGPGAFLGEIDALRAASPAKCAARVVSPGKLFAVDRVDLCRFFDGNPGVLLSFMGTRFVE